MSRDLASASARSPKPRWRRTVVVATAALTVLGSGAAAATGGVIQPDAGEGSPGHYTVVQGDGFQQIAEAIGVPIESLLARNGLTVDFTLHPGFVLIVPEGDFVPPSTVALPEATDTTPEETAAPGETEPPAATQPSEATQPPGTQPPGTQPPGTQAPGTQPPPPPPTEPPTTPAPTAPPAPPASGTGDCVVGGIGWINNARAEQGLAAIGQGDAGFACSHSRTQAESGSMYHSGSAPCGWEIVGYSSSSPDDLPGAWLNSPDHRAIVTAPEISSGAVAYVQNLATGYWYGTGTFC